MSHVTFDSASSSNGHPQHAAHSTTLNRTPPPPPPVILKQDSDEAKRVVRAARQMVGQTFVPGSSEQCANFVRKVFHNAQVPIGSTQSPIDRHLLKNPNDIGEGYADSFAGNDVGKHVSDHDIRPGDIVMYLNTYGDFKPGVITHVGIYVGNNTIVHRPTKSGLVVYENLHVFRIGDIRRPNSYTHTTIAAHSAKMFEHDGHASGLVNGCPQAQMEVKLIFAHGKVKAYVNGRPVDPVNLNLQLFY